MKGYYQILEDNIEKIDYRKGSSFKFPAHFHKKIELFILKKGEYDITLNGKNFTLKSGDIAFFDCYDIHSYAPQKTPDCVGLVLIIPTFAISKFLNFKGGKKILNPIISNSALCDEIYNLGVNFIVPTEYDDNIKSCAIELIASLLSSHLILSNQVKADETSLVQNLLRYLNSNFQSDLSLKNMSKEFGYSPEHISRIFHRYLDISLPDYANQLRLEYIENALKKDGSRKITDLIFEAGFNSIQTYYRAKRKFYN